MLKARPEVAALDEKIKAAGQAAADTADTSDK
ncbi:hypothetical protein GGD56_007356 [Rhizobium mongolense]|uniref:Uncharacterized protein n=1 Tax=Rhizobium mongolense TaxID=57676 RepID=A0ABR6IZW3_9HYPH|nr:hypothetical protein [Rhizobium mongolense]